MGEQGMKEKIFEVAKFCVCTLGLQNPTEKTKEKIVQTMLAAANPSASAEDSKECLDMLSTCLTSLREINKDKRIPLADYGSDEQVFLSNWPNRYAPEHAPVPSKVTEEQLHLMSLTTVCRSTSRKLKAKDASADSILDAPKKKDKDASPPSSAVVLPTHQTGMQGSGPHGNMAMMWNMMQFMQSQMQQQQNLPAMQESTSAHTNLPRRAPSALALMDGPLHDHAHEHSGGSAHGGPSDGAHAGAPHGGSAHGCASDSAGVDDKLNEIAGLVGSVKSGTKGKGGSKPKGSTPTLKKPAAAIDRITVAPKMPTNLGLKFSPISYLDFKVYSSPGVWRALKKGEKVDVPFRHNGDTKVAAGIWQKMLKHIETNSS